MILSALPAAKAAALAGLVALFIGGVATVVVGLKAYAAGREKERLIQTEIIGKMVNQAAIDKSDADARADTLTESWRLARQKADHDQERERATTRRTLSALRADGDRMRDELASAARGGVEESADSIGACRDRAGTLGSLLGEALRASEQCAGEAEDLATSVRTLRSAWPVAASPPEP